MGRNYCIQGCPRNCFVLLEAFRKCNHATTCNSVQQYVTGQDRNLKLTLMWLKVVQSTKNAVELINHKFLYSGHSYLPNDADFGTIESTIRKKDCCMPLKTS